MAIKYYSGINISGNIVPSADSTYNLGGPAFYFANVYADNLHGDGSNITNIGAAESALTLTVTVKNKSGGSLAKGTVVHAAPSANPPSGNIIEVIAADYDTVANMPGLGVLNETLANDAEGEAVMFGAVSGIDTSSFLVGTELYVGNNGALTGTKPTATNQLIQKIAVVIKSHATNGLIKVFGAGRTNDVPNEIDRTIQFDANQRFTDNSLILMGGGDMFQIGHKASYSQIATYEGNLYIDNNANDFDIVFRSDDGNGGLATYYYLDGSEGLNRFSKNILLSDDVSLSLGNGFDLKLLHNGTASYIDNSTGNLTIRNLADDSDVIISSDNGSGGTTQYFRADGGNGSVVLYHYGSRKFETTSDGAKVSGDLEVTGDFTVSGTTTFIDTTHLNVGDNIITLNADLSGSTAPTENAGIAIYRGSSSSVSFEWDETNDIWTLGDQGLVADNLNITKENAAPTLNLLKGGNDPSTNELIGRLNFQTDYSGSPQDWARINVETNSSSVRTDMDFYVKSTSGNLETALRLQGGSSTPKAFFYNDVDVDGGITVSSGLGVSGGLTVENADGDNVGHVQIGTVDNDAGNNYVRGNILIGRDQDQVTWNSANDEWTYTGGGSSDFSMILSDSGGFRIFTGDAVTSGTTYTNQEFKDAFQAIAIGHGGNVNVYRGELQMGGSTAITDTRIFTSNSTASDSVPKYTFAGDTDTGLGYIGTNSVGLIAQGSRKFYINNTNAYFQNLSGGVNIDSDLNVDGNTFKVDSTNNRVAINGSISSNSRAYIFDSDSDPDTTSQGLWVRGVYSGTKSVAADHIKRGIYVDLDSSASGTTTDEHMLFGIQVDVRNSGLADNVTGVYSYVESNLTTQTATHLKGGYFAVATDISNATGRHNELRGVEGHVSIQDLGGFNNAYASYNRIDVLSNRNANLGALYGGYFELEINNPNANSYGTMFGVRSAIDNNEGTVPNVGTSYLFYGDYQGTRAASNSWGVYVHGDKHYLEGKLGIGTTDLTTHALNVSGSGYISGGLTSNGVSITGGSAFNTFNSTHTDRRLTINQSSGEYPRIYNFDEGDQTFHSIKIGGGNNETSGIVVDGSGNVTIHGTLDVSGTIDLSNANLDIGSADIVFGTLSTNANRGLVWDVDGSYLSKLVSGGTNGGIVEIYNNMDGAITGGSDVFRIKQGSTASVALAVKGNGNVEIPEELYIGDGNIRCNNTIDHLTTAGAAQTGKFKSIQVSTSYSGTAPDNGILFGTDTNLYRSAANQLRTDDALVVVGTANFQSAVTIDTGASSNALTIRGTSPTISFLDDSTDADDFYIHINSHNFYVLRDAEGANNVGTGWDTPHPLQLEGDTNIGYLFGDRIFDDGYHPNADKWTTARTLTINGDASGSVSWDGSSNATLTLSVGDADTLDGLNSTQFLRSDANDSTTGQLTVESGLLRVRNDSGNIASIRLAEDTASDHVILEYDGTGSGATNYFHMYSNVSGWATKGSSFNMQPSTGNVNIGSTNFGYKFRVDGTAYLGKTTIVGTANANDPTLKITSTTSNTYNHAIEAFNSNLTSGEANIVLFGKEGNTKNSGYIGYEWLGAGSNNNFVTIGHWGADHLFRVYPDQITGNSSFRAPIFYDINNTGYYLHGDGTSRLNLLNVNAVGTSVAGIGKVMFPYGAEYNSGSTTGAIKITLPQSWTNTMMTMKITIFDYSINESFEVHCGGYNYAGGGGYWVNTHAKIIANGEMDRNFNVRFGHDGSKCCILIGETNSAWAYPKVVVTEWVGGHSAETFNNWDNGWDISIVTTLPSNIDQVRSNNQIGRYQSITYDTGNTNYYSDPASVSNFNEVRFLNYLKGNGQIVAQCTDSYLRINQSGQFSSGIWFGDSHLKQGSNRYIGLGGNGGTTSSRVWLYGGAYTGTNVIKIDGSTGIIQTTTDSVRAPRFYDYNNTGYYVDPASTSILERLYIYEGTNGGGAQIRFSDHASGSYAQYGTLEYVHSDSASYGSGNAFKFYGNQSSMSFHVAGKGLFTQDIIAYYSDMRLKTKLGDIEDPIGKIQALNGFYYEPNEVAQSYGYEVERKVGLSAQDVKEVVPEAVTDAPIGDGYMAVDYAKLVPVLVEAIKEQQKQIDELKKLINP